MRFPTTPAVLLLAALLLLPVPLAVADDPLAIHVPHLRVGDRLLVVETRTPPADPGMRAEGDADEPTIVVAVEGAGEATDRYGIPRPTDAFREDRRYGDEARASVRCHHLQGGRDLVRIDLLAYDGPVSGGGGSTGFLLPGKRIHAESVPLHRYEGACAVSNVLGGRTLREGDRLPLGDVAPWMDPAQRDVLSGPARAGSAHGRDALVFPFDPRLVFPGDSDLVRSIEATLADGLPGVLSFRVVAQGPYEGASSGVELRGIERGAGPELAPYDGAALPERSPHARFGEAKPLALDDAGYGLAFPYAEAYRALLDDPRAGFALWLQAHPDASLRQARYDAVRGEPAAGPRVEASWTLSFRDKGAAFVATVELLSGVATPAGTVGAPARVHHVTASQDEGDARDEAPLRAQVADSRSVARAVAGAGVSLGEVASIWYDATSVGGTAFATATFSTTRWDQERGRGNEVTVDLVSGGLASVDLTTVRTFEEGGLLAPASGSLEPSRASALSFLAGPGPGSGLAVGGAAATGLALLVVFLKFLAVPLFTRLRRDRLLDNPVRARLYERVRAEPGIHLAELVDFAGIGQGATRHHVALLVKHRLLVETRDGGFVRYFAAGEVPPDVARREMALRPGAARAVYDLLAAEPGLSLREAGARLGMSGPSVFRHRKRLEKAGLLPAAPDARVRAVEA